MKIWTRVRPNPFNNGGEFELDQARSKNNIAENSIAPGHETHNPRFLYLHSFLYSRSHHESYHLVNE